MIDNTVRPSEAGHLLCDDDILDELWLFSYHTQCTQHPVKYNNNVMEKMTYMYYKQEKERVYIYHSLFYE